MLNSVDYIRALTNSGLASKQAEEIVNVVDKSLQTSFASKIDFKEFEMSTAHKFDKLRIYIDLRFEQTELRFEQIDNRFEQIEIKLEQTKAYTDQRFNEMHLLIDHRFEKIENLIKISVLSIIITITGAVCVYITSLSGFFDRFFKHVKKMS